MRTLYFNRKKIHRANRGPLTEEHKKKIGDANRGKKLGPLSEEHKKKVGDALRGKKYKKRNQ